MTTTAPRKLNTGTCGLCGSFIPDPRPGQRYVRCPRCHSDIEVPRDIEAAFTEAHLAGLRDAEQELRDRHLTRHNAPDPAVDWGRQAEELQAEAQAWDQRNEGDRFE
jgi:transposase